MSQGGSKTLADWTDVQFFLIVQRMLNNDGDYMCKINGVVDKLSFSVVGENWYFKHEGFPDGSITVSSLFSGSLTPKSIAP